MQYRSESAAPILKALAKAVRDPRRSDLRTEGIEERDLAFEAGLLLPMDTELPRYANVKRGAIVRILEQMEKQGLIQFKDAVPGRLYKVLPTAEGESIAERLLRPWHQKLMDWVLGRSS